MCSPMAPACVVLFIIVYTNHASSSTKDMAECAPLPVGGYNSDFIHPPPDSLNCPICLLPFRDPHLLSCCGAKYCEACIGRVKSATQPCPLCGEQPFNSMLDKSYQRKVLDLKVYCSKKKDGCDWEGELRRLEQHEKEDCGWAMAQCSYQCGGRVFCRDLAKHERDECPLRPVDAKLESFMHKMEVEKERHKREVATLRQEFKQALHDEREFHKRELEKAHAAWAKEFEENLRKEVTAREELKQQLSEHIEYYKRDRHQLSLNLKANNINA